MNINIAYYHDDPYKFTFGFHAIPQKHYYEKGVYIKGGGQSLSDALCDIIREGGGEIRLSSDVKKIMVENGKAKGVIYHDKKSKEDVIELTDGNIIANCDPKIVYEELIDSKIEEYEGMKNLPISCSLLSIYMILNKNISNIYKDIDYATFITEKNIIDAPLKEFSVRKYDIEDRDFAFVNYSKIDSGLNDGDRHFATMTTISYIDEWENLSPQEYKNRKAKIVDTAINRLEKFYPGIKKYIEYAECATPKTIKRYTKATEGDRKSVV